VSVAASLAYDDRGRGEPVVLIHGHPFSRRMWAPQLEGLSEDFRLLAPDLPGYGASPPVPGKITMRELADAVLGLMEAVEIGRGTIVGLSMGGLVGMELALAHPERVNGLVLAATTAAPVTAEEVEARRTQAAEIERDGMLATALAMAGRLFGPEARKNPELVAEVFTMMIWTPPAGAAAALRGRAERPDYSVLLRDVDVPSLVIAGDNDSWAPDEVTDQLLASLTNAELLRFPGAGHLPNLEDPERFNAGLRAFVAEISR
jgi:pimeloyl-ACP methyl ester carboxylesterase